MYTHFIELANFRVPLSKFLLCILQYFQIHLSQLSIIGAAKVSHFELMCRVVGHAPTVGTFRRFYVNSLSNGWLSFSRRSGAHDPCCVSKKFDSLKNWNNHFFWIDAMVFPLSVPWFNGTSIVKDPLPVEDAVHFLCVELLNLNRTVIRKYLETFLCLVGLSRSFTENDVRPTLLCDDDEEMGLLDFVQSADPFKVKTGERTLATDEFSLVDHTIHDELKTARSKKKKRVAFVAGPPPAKRARTEDVATSDARPATADNSLVALRRLIKQGASEDGGFGSVVPAMEDLASSVTLTSEREYEDDSDHGNNVRTRLLSGRFCHTPPRRKREA
ncbi:hypothetical protein Tco_0870530 [Tanacetum coccineum]